VDILPDVRERLLLALAGYRLSIAYISNASVDVMRGATYSACNFITIFVTKYYRTLLHIVDVCTR